MTESSSIYGSHAVISALKQKRRNVLELFIQKDREKTKHAAIIALAEDQGIPWKSVSAEELDTLFFNCTHQGVGAKVSELPKLVEKDLADYIQSLSPPYLFLILDGITDPHNLGACLRSGDAALVNAVILPKDNSASINSTVSKVASGATESVPIITVTNLARCLTLLKANNFWIYGAAGEAQETLWQMDFTGNIALVMGAEGKGLRRLTKEHCDKLFSIPMQGTVKSLNVSVATGISLFEVRRQNLANSKPNA
ncbi:MAG: 23S rRNA (guanosine(2251)-2'-O)-methyltransferase RlmB [Legionellales bacterium RIFCSPHIGHO2_12_FULL_37_14]|nr:MAG: 23S rRNA (guanosine(2251)-2'-O)-methyltransferase RlmB [Legionellales bacterium RIFCSPHIGHO2_12_FULL_37_14]